MPTFPSIFADPLIVERVNPQSGSCSKAYRRFQEEIGGVHGSVPKWRAVADAIPGRRFDARFPCAGFFQKAGIYGMNVENMPELHWEYGYFTVLGVIATACAGLFWRFRRAGWL